MKQLSYWERAHYSQADVCIIGAGIVGLSAAYYLAGLDPKLNILVLERGSIPEGASTRNAGFACFGSISEILEDIKNEGRDTTMKRVEARWKGLQQLLSLTGENAIDYTRNGGFEIFGEEDKDLFEQCSSVMDEVNRDLHNCFGNQVYYQSSNSIEEFGFTGCTGMIGTRYEGSLDPVRLIEKLGALARQRGVKIIHGIDVRNIRNNGSEIELHSDELNIVANACLVATNGFATNLIDLEDVRPARAQVLITSEIEDLKLNGCFHANRGYTYFRNVGKRIMLGGGRNLAAEEEFTDSMETTPAIQSYLEEFIRTRILEGSNYSIEQRWSGTMGLGRSKSPIIRNVKGKIYCAVRLGGMGIAIGNHVGEQAAEMVHSGISA